MTRIFPKVGQGKFPQVVLQYYNVSVETLQYKVGREDYKVTVEKIQ